MSAMKLFALGSEEVLLVMLSLADGSSLSVGVSPDLANLHVRALFSFKWIHYIKGYFIEPYEIIGNQYSLASKISHDISYIFLTTNEFFYATIIYNIESDHVEHCEGWFRIKNEI